MSLCYFSPLQLNVTLPKTIRSTNMVLRDGKPLPATWIRAQRSSAVSDGLIIWLLTSTRHRGLETKTELLLRPIGHMAIGSTRTLHPIAVYLVSPFHTVHSLMLFFLCRWALISDQLPGRTGNSVKNRWNSTLSKRKFASNQLNLQHYPVIQGLIRSSGSHSDSADEDDANEANKADHSKPPTKESHEGP